MGIIANSKVVTRAERTRNPDLVQPGNTDWVTVVHGINSQGWWIPPLIILAGVNHLAKWYKESSLPSNWRIAVSDKGWTDDKLGYEWIQHFNAHTEARKRGSRRLLILDGHSSHHSIRFEDYCKENNIITLCMPPHSSHILQPLDVACFGPLKVAYSRQIERKMRAGVSHITKEDFLAVYYPTHLAALTLSNIQNGFEAVGLVPHNPDEVLSLLPPKVPSPRSVSPHSSQYEPKTPGNNLKDVQRLTSYIEARKGLLKNSNSPGSTAYSQLLKGYEKTVISLALLVEQNKVLKEENAHQKRKRALPNTRIQKRGTITIGEAQDLMIGQQVAAQLRNESRKRPRGEPTHDTSQQPHKPQRRCSKCKQPGHNARTCPEA